MKNILILFFALLSFKSYAGFNFEYSNDFFTGTDQYFSQGIELVYKNDSLKKFLPKTPLFIKKRKILATKYSIHLDYYGFTPKDAYPPNIQFGDRPFSNVFLLGGKTDSFLKKHQIQISSTIRLGAIGKMTGGEFVHKTIHKATGNKLPRGWDNQIQNDLLISYKANLAKYFHLLNNFLEVKALVEIEFGTYKVVQSLGGSFSLGKINSFDELSSDKEANSYYLFLSSVISQVSFDSTMQGGLLNRDSPYKLTSKDVENYVGSLKAGVHLGVREFSIRYQQVWMTKEFSQGEKHSYGKLSLIFNF